MNFWIFCWVFKKIFWIFWIFLDFDIFYGFFLKCPKQHSKPLFCPKGKKSLGLGQSPAQDLEVGPRSGPYFLVSISNTRISIQLLLSQSVTLTVPHWILKRGGLESCGRILIFLNGKTQLIFFKEEKAEE